MSQSRPSRLVARIAAVASTVLDGNLRGARSVAATLPTDAVELKPAEEQLRVAVLEGDAELADAWARVVQCMLASNDNAGPLDVQPVPNADGLAVGTVCTAPAEKHAPLADLAGSPPPPPVAIPAASISNRAVAVRPQPPPARPRQHHAREPSITATAPAAAVQSARHQAAWTETSPERVCTVHRGAIAAVASSRTHAYTCGADGRVIDWDLRTNTRRAMPSSYSGNVCCCAVSNDGRMVASGSADGKVRVWCAATTKKLHTMHEHSGKVHSVAFSPDGSKLASTCTSVRVWRTPDAECIAVLPSHASTFCCGFSNSDGGKWLVAGSGGQSLGRLLAWDWQHGTDHADGAVRRLGSHSRAVWSCAYNASDAWVISSSLDQTVKVADAVSGTVLRSFLCDGPAVHAMFLGDGTSHILSCGRDGAVRVWDVSTERAIGSFEGHTKAVYGMTVHGSAHLLTCGEDGRCCLWKLPDSLVFRVRQ